MTEDGGVYRIVDRDREAFHAGRSMWCGKEDVDKFSVGIECVGHHDKAMPMVQLMAIKSLVKDLQAMYSVTDDRVIAHSHVAYGAPNKWHRYRHRGRKRCGMLFAMPSVRRILGLRLRPAYDPDTRAGRLRNADAYLAGVLYGSTDTMRARYASQSTPAVPAGMFRMYDSTPRTATAPKRPPAEPKKSAPQPAPRPRAQAGPPAASPKTVEDLKRRGWSLRGTVSKSLTASKIAGKRWNASDTYYTIRGKVIPGNQINASKIEKGMGVWMRAR